MGGTSTSTTITIIPHLLFLYSSLALLSSGTNFPSKKQIESNSDITTTGKDITTPITTVPTTTTTPISFPVLNPDSVTMTPLTYPASSTGASWCVASPSASKWALQIALDYACGIGGADCREIQVGGNCYEPNTLFKHASFAFNQYYQSNPIPSSCNFAGTALTTSTNPSTETCPYPSTSISASILNTTVSNGSRVYGAAPAEPSPSSACRNLPFKFSCLSIVLNCVLFLILKLFI